MIRYVDGLLPLLVSNLRRPWSPAVSAYDICETGIAISVYIRYDVSASAGHRALDIYRWRYHSYMPPDHMDIPVIYIYEALSRESTIAAEPERVIYRSIALPDIYRYIAYIYLSRRSLSI